MYRYILKQLKLTYYLNCMLTNTDFIIIEIIYTPLGDTLQKDLSGVFRGTRMPALCVTCIEHSVGKVGWKENQCWWPSVRADGRNPPAAPKSSPNMTRETTCIKSSPNWEFLFGDHHFIQTFLFFFHHETLMILGKHGHGKLTASFPKGHLEVPWQSVPSPPRNTQLRPLTPRFLTLSVFCREEQLPNYLHLGPILASQAVNAWQPPWFLCEK